MLGFSFFLWIFGFLVTLQCSSLRGLGFSEFRISSPSFFAVQVEGSFDAVAASCSRFCWIWLHGESDNVGYFSQTVLLKGIAHIHTRCFRLISIAL